MAMAHGIPCDERHSLDGDVRHGFDGRVRVRKIRLRFLRVQYTRHARHLVDRLLGLADACAFDAACNPLQGKAIDEREPSIAINLMFLSGTAFSSAR